MSRKEFAIWIFPIITSILAFSPLFEYLFGRPVLGFTVGVMVGAIIGLITKLIADDFPFTDASSSYSKKVTINDIFLIPRIYCEIWLIPLKRLLGFSVRYVLIIGLTILLLYFILTAIRNGL